MNTISTLTKLSAIVIGSLLITGIAQADKPNWAADPQGKSEQHGKGHGNKEKKHSQNENDDRDSRDGRDDRNDRNGRDDRDFSHFFNDKHRVEIHDYYVQESRKGKCPPGLAKKNNGCMPPGQAKKWQKGRPLPRDVVYVDLPRSVITVIGVPPAGHRYVRVANDILLIAIGTGMIIDAIEDINRR
jgi:Ni/Co efflux regulator RcnB